ncbi:MAG TPA: DUF3732 domain-containing protein [Candidatus Angelobacter sp.]|nr:DUF3732 domain-containing protein [Candidatus Angelobacter sp.]
MKLNIQQLILWPEATNNPPVQIELPANKVSVITGWSGTGKSSIIAIVDYVLGSDKCAIPVGIIRESVSWYGLRVETALGVMRIARRSPHDQDYSNDYELLTHDEGARAATQFPIRNRHLDDFKALMDSLCGLSDLPLVSGEQPKGWSGRASFRDMAAFNFLPQHIVANPYTLFFKTDTTEHREKLRRVFPVVLGSKTNQQLRIEHQLSGLQSEEKRLSLELRQRRSAIESWRAQVAGSYLRAQELNLISQGKLPAGIPEMIEVLRTVAENPSRGIRRQPVATTRSAVTQLEQLRQQEEYLDHLLGDARRRLRRLKALDATVNDYGNDLLAERDRVKGLDWFAEAAKGERQCPMCGALETSAAEIVEQLRVPVRQLEELTNAAVGARPRLDKEAIDLEKEIRSLEQRLFADRRMRQELEIDVRPNIGETAGQRLEDVYTFIGQLRQGLAAISEVEDESGLSAKQRELSEKIRSYESELREIRSGSNIDEVLTKISVLIQEHAVFLGLGHQDRLPSIDLRELNLRFFREADDKEDVKQKSDFLWEIGSGANWMGYHLSVFLALHQILSERRAVNPVPSFLIIDQPSQVYFPSDTFKDAVEANRTSSTEGKLPLPIRDRSSDLAKTRRIFELLVNAKSLDKLDLQIIVLEHADETTWTGLDSVVTKVRDWRGSGEKLIPESWLSK